MASNMMVKRRRRVMVKRRRQCDEAFEWERCIACQLKSVRSAFQYQLQQQCDGLHPMLVGLVSLQATSKSREHRKCEVRATKAPPRASAQSARVTPREQMLFCEDGTAAFSVLTFCPNR